MIFKDKSYKVEVDTAGGDVTSASVKINGEWVQNCAGVRIVPETETDPSTVIMVLHGVYTVVDGDENKAVTLLVPTEETEALLNAWQGPSGPPKDPITRDEFEWIRGCISGPASKVQALFDKLQPSLFRPDKRKVT